MEDSSVGEPVALLGRENVLDAVQRLLAPGPDDGGALMIHGDPGVGKSALLDAAAALARARGHRVLRATGIEFLTDLTFSTLTTLLGPLRQYVDDLDATTRQPVAALLGMDVATELDQLRRYSSVLALVRAASTQSPVLLLVDDVHWADRASASALAYLARRLQGTRVVLLAASRPVRGGLYGLAGLPHQRVAPLERAEATALLTVRYPELDEPTTRRVMDEAEGNPLALLELPQALATEARRHGLPAPGAVLPLTRRLRMLYAAQVEELPIQTRHLLLVAALEGTGDLGTVAAAARHADLSALAPAERAELVLVDIRLRCITFRHPLVRATVVETASPGDRLEVHGALAEALRDDPVRHSRHLAETAVEPDEHIAARLERAARLVLARGDAAGAFLGLLRAADLSPSPGARSRRLTAAAYVGLDVSGELRVAGQLLVEARRADPSLRGSLQAAVAAAFLLLNADGDLVMAHRLLLGALKDSGAARADDAEARAQALVTFLEICLYGATPELWQSYVEVAAGPTPPMSPATQVYVDVLTTLPDVTDRTADRVEELVNGLHQESDPTRLERVATAALFLDRAASARGPLTRLVEDGRAGGAVASAINAFVVLAVDAFHSGQWDECVAYCDEGTAMCDGSGYLLLRWPLMFGRGMVAAARGETAVAADVVDEMDRWSAGRGILAVHRYARHVSALAHLGQGDAEAAFAEVTQVCRPGELPPYLPQASWATLDLVEAAVETGRQQEVMQHLGVLRRSGLTRHAARTHLMWAGGIALTAAPGDAPQLYEAALALPGSARWPFERARIQLRYGQHLRRAHDMPAAREHLTDALGTFRRLGAPTWEERASAALRSAGAATAGAPTTSLTIEESRIAELAATGLTNRQIGEILHLSHRTVGARLHQIFPKLGVTTRATLRDALSRRSDD